MLGATRRSPTPPLLSGLFGRGHPRCQHHSAVINQIVDPMRGRDQGVGFRCAFLMVGGSRQLGMEDRIDLLLDRGEFCLIVSLSYSARQTAQHIQCRLRGIEVERQESAMRRQIPRPSHRAPSASDKSLGAAGRPGEATPVPASIPRARPQGLRQLCERSKATASECAGASSSIPCFYLLLPSPAASI